MEWFVKTKYRIKQIRSWRSVAILAIGLIIGAMLDVIVMNTGMVWIPVNKDYPNEVFGAACGVRPLKILCKRQSVTV